MLIQTEANILLFTFIHLSFDIVYVSHTFFFIFFSCDCCAREYREKKTIRRHSLDSLKKRKRHPTTKSSYSSLSLFSSLFFCIAIHVSLSLSLFLPYLQTIHLNVRLSLRNRQKKRSKDWCLYFFARLYFRLNSSTCPIFTKNDNSFLNVYKH